MIATAPLQNERNGDDATHHDGGAVPNEGLPAPVFHGVQGGAIKAWRAAAPGDANVRHIAVSRQQDREHDRAFFMLSA
jgi:hypothetical protein